MNASVKLNEAIEMLLSQKIELKTEMVPLKEALNRVAAADVLALNSMPPFAKSPFDGYAMYAADTAGASRENPVRLKILREIPAGTPAGAPINRGEAVNLFTGAPLPEGADTTIKFEDVDVEGDTLIIYDEHRQWKDVIRPGENCTKGDMLVEKGAIITPPLLATMATQGISRVEVYRKPKAAILSTGSELVEVGTPCGDAQIYNSNYYALYGYLTGAGYEVVNAGINRDDCAVISSTINRMMDEEGCDIVVSTGGASVGDYDFAVGAAEQIGAEILFWKVGLKPGGAMVIANRGGKMLISLSGNPGASLMGLLMVAAPFLRKLCGRKDIYHKTVKMHLADSQKKGAKSPKIMKGHAEFIDAEVYFVENSGGGNGSVNAFNNCTMLGIIPANSEPLEAGTLIDVLLIDKNFTI